MNISTNNLSHAQWLAERKKGIGGSDVAAVLGMSKYKSPLDVYNDKLGLSEPTPMNEAMEAGVRFEPEVARWWSDKTGYKVIRDNKIRKHKSLPYLIANVDRIILPNSDHSSRGILEVKTAGVYAANNWEDEPPVAYFLQLQHYFGVTGYTWGEFAVLIGGNNLRRYYVEADQELIEMTNEKLKSFWENNVLKQIPPQPICDADITTLYERITNCKAIEAVEAVAKQAEQLKDLKQQIKTLKEQEEELETGLKLVLRDADTLTYGGDIIATWKQAKDSNLFQKELFQKENPEVYTKYCYTKPGSRRFIIK